MGPERERKLGLSDPGRDAAGEELEKILADAEGTEEDDDVDDVGLDSFLERFPVAARQRVAPK